MPFGFNFNLFNFFNNEEANARRPTTERNVITFEEGLKTLQTCEDYIKSKVLPSLREKKDETLLRVLLERWLNYKIMTKGLANFFSHLERYFLARFGYPNLEETSFLSFYHLVYDEEMNQEIRDDIVAMIDRKLAGEKFEYTFVINTLDFYLRFDECTRKNRKKVKMDVLSKKLNLISSDGAVFEVDYGVALMSSRFLGIIETISVGDVGNIFVDEVSSNILNMVIEYCKKQKQNQNKDLDAEFVVNVDLKTLIDLTIAACYLKVDSLMKLSWSKVDNLINGKTPEEISQIFGAADRRLKLRAIRREQQVESFHFSCFDCDLDTISVDSKMLGH